MSRRSLEHKGDDWLTSSLTSEVQLTEDFGAAKRGITPTLAATNSFGDLKVTFPWVCGGKSIVSTSSKRKRKMHTKGIKGVSPFEQQFHIQLARLQGVLQLLFVTRFCKRCVLTCPPLSFARDFFNTDSQLLCSKVIQEMASSAVNGANPRKVKQRWITN